MTELPPMTAVSAWPAGTTTYSTTLDDLQPTEGDGTFSREINDITAAVNAIEATLGTTPAGAYPTIKAALTGLQTLISGLQAEIDDIIAVPGPPNTFFKFTQATPTDVWDITHTLGRKTAVTVTDSAGTPVEGEVDFISDSRLTITFSAAFAGEALLS